MRTSVAVILAIVIAFSGVVMLSYQSQDVRDTAMNNSTDTTQDIYNMTDDTYQGMAEVMSPGIVWFGIAAFLLVAAGFLVAKGGR